tara:strand:- start:950 stop:1252 length:303 start_codon:yes stop_codon:yes gene_type:complete
MIKIYLLISLFFLLHACSGFTEAGKILRNEKKASTDEFLVKKKQPLVLPPEYDKIPEPGSMKKQEAEEDNLKKILKAPKEMNVKKKETSTENSILENIRK